MDFDKFKFAVGVGFDKIAGISKPVDPFKQEQDIYDNLKPDDFATLIKRFGEEDVLGYIKNMEFRRMKGTPNG